jgi:hypothetical protein
MKDFFLSRFTTVNNYFHTQHFPSTDWKNIFHWSYWTESYLPPTTIYSLLTIIVGIIVCAALLTWRSFLKKKQRQTPVYDGPIDQLSNIVFFIIITLLTYAFFRNQSVAYLSSRLVVLGIIAVTLIWLGVVVYQLWKKIPAKQAAYLEKERFFRYLPKRSKEREKNNI